MSNGEKTGTEIATTQKKGENLAMASGVPSANAQLVINNASDLYMIAKMINASGLAPRGMDVNQIAVAILQGREVGLPTMYSVQNIAVINGKPCMWGDAIVALVLSSNKLEYLLEEWEEKTRTFTVKIKRRGLPEHVESFSWADAERAALTGKDTYKKFPKRMLGWKAKTYAIRSQFADVLGGFTTREEAEDFAVVDVTPEAAPTANLRARLDAVTQTTDEGEDPGQDAAPEVEETPQQPEPRSDDTTDAEVEASAESGEPEPEQTDEPPQITDKVEAFNAVATEFARVGNKNAKPILKSHGVKELDSSLPLGVLCEILADLRGVQ